MNFLFECAPINPATGVPTTYRFSSLHGQSGSTLVDGKEWESAIFAAPEETVTYYQAGLVQQASIDYGAITLQLTAGTANLANMLWDGATGRVWVGVEGQELSSYEKFFEGVLGAHSKDGDQLKIPLYGLDFKLNETDILTSKYGGTGGVEGPVSIKGTFKPRAYGYCRYVTPIRIDTAYVVYQVHDGACQNIPAVYENAMTLGDPAFTVSTYAQLIGLTLKPGTWARAPAVGMFRLANEPSGKFTADVVGDVAAGQNLASIATAILVGAGLSASDIDASVASVAGSIAWDTYLTDQATVGETLRKPFADAFLYLTANEFGKFQAGSWLADGATINVGGPNAMFNVIPGTLTLEGAAPSTYSVTVNAEKCWTVHDSQDISPAIAELQEGQAANNDAAIAAQKTADQAVASIVVERARTDAIIDDGVFDRSEKAGQKLAYAGITTDYAKNVAQANIYNVSSTAYANAYAALNTYLSSLSPPWNDITQDTPIVRATWDAAWEGERAARKAILRAIADATAKLANWPSITGDGKPEDNATVGAPNGTQVGGVPVESVVDAIKDGNGVVKSARQQVAEGNAILDVKIAAAKKAATDASAEAAQIRLDLVPTIASAKQAGLDASAAATKISTDLSAEVSRAKDAEGTLRTRIETAQGGAEGALSLIATETTQRTEKDAALTQRIDSVISTSNIDRTNANTAITNEITARTTAIDAVGRRIDSVTTAYQSADGVATTRIAAEELARATAVEALGQRSNILESQLSGSAASGLQNLIKNSMRNLIDLAWWKSGAALPWTTNGGQRNEIYAVPDSAQNFANLKAPDGSSGDVWLSQADASGGPAGGWNNAPIRPLDPDKTYRFSVAIASLRVAGQSGTSYWGTSGIAALNTGTAQDNPYFAVASLPVPNRWYLFVGFIFPRNSTGKTHDGSGVFDTVTGAKISDGNNFCFRPDGAQPIHRAYQYYATVGTYQAFGRPVVELVDGSETNITAPLIAAASIKTEELARAATDEALSQRIVVTEAKLNGSQDSEVLARIRNEEYARAFADTALVNRATALEARSGGGGNLLTNTDFQTTVGWDFGGNLGPVTSTLNIAGPLYYPPGENVLSFYQGTNTGQGFGGYHDWVSTTFAVQGGTYLQAYVYSNAHRAHTQVYLSWYDSNGTTISQPTSALQSPQGGYGNSIGYYAQIGFKSILVPANATAARFSLRKYDTDAGHADSYAWFLRPYIGIAREGQTEWNPYSPGSGKAAINAANARITAEETARANADGALTSTINTVDANWRGANDARYNEIIAANTRITNEATASSNRDGALGTQINNVNAAYRADVANLGTDIGRVNQEVINTNAQVSSVNQASANRDAALGSRVDSVVATYNQANTDRYNQTVAVDSRVTSEAIASANRDGALGSRIDSVTATANGATSSAGIALSAAQDAQTKLGQARVVLTADAGNGRAQLSLYSDSYGNGAADLVGDLAIKGSAGGATTIIKGVGATTYASNGARVFQWGIY